MTSKIDWLVAHRLWVAIGFQTVLAFARTIHLVLTAFMTPDEADYILRAFFFQSYSDRLVPAYVQQVFYYVLHVNSFYGVVFSASIYFLMWSVPFLFFADKIVCIFTENAHTRFLSLMLVFASISYSVFSVTFLTESPSLLFATVGVFGILSYKRLRKSFLYGGLGFFSLILATYSREPYFFLVVVGLVILLPLSQLYSFLRKGSYLLTRRSLVPVSVLIFLVLFLLVLPAQSPLYQVLSYQNLFSFIQRPTPSLGPSPLVQSPLVSTSIPTFLQAIPNYRYTSLISYPSSYLSIVEQIFTGLVLGLNPIGAFLVTAGTVYLLWKKEWLLFLLSSSFFVTFFIILLAPAEFPNFYLTQGLSLLVRFSQPFVLVGLIVFPLMIDRLGHRRLLAILVVLVLIGGSQASLHSVQSQSGELAGYNVLSLIPAGSLQALQYFQVHPNSTVIIAWDWNTGNLLLSGVPGLITYPPHTNAPGVNTVTLEDDAFVGLHLSEFYLFIPTTVYSYNVTDSIINMGLQGKTVFVYNSLCYLAETSSYLAQATHTTEPPIVNPAVGEVGCGYSAPYTVTSTNVIVNSSTGSLIRVGVHWP